jgi:hypothetical protein
MNDKTVDEVLFKPDVLTKILEDCVIKAFDKIKSSEESPITGDNILEVFSEKILTELLLVPEFNDDKYSANSVKVTPVMFTTNGIPEIDVELFYSEQTSTGSQAKQIVCNFGFELE